MTTIQATSVCSTSVVCKDGSVANIRYFVRGDVLSSPLADIANLGGMARNANPINQTIQALQPYLFFAKIYHQTARCGPTLQMLKEVEAHTICPKGKLACRHLIHMIETYRPGDTLPLETTVPDAVAINPNTFRPDYKTVGPE